MNQAWFTATNTVSSGLVGEDEGAVSRQYQPPGAPCTIAAWWNTTSVVTTVRKRSRKRSRAAITAI